MIIDFHNHAFPDELAARAMPRLEEAAGVKAFLDGTLEQLRRSMEGAGVDLSVLQHIATRPGQERAVNTWAAEIQGEGILSFGTIHPATPEWRDELTRIVDHGLKGIKFHPDYQDFFVDEERLFPLYEAICAKGLIILFHAGIDIGLPDPCHGRPERIRRVVDRFPEGKWVAAHMGGYLCWDEVEQNLLGHPLYLDTCYSLADLGAERMRSFIRAHGVERILFGSDSPWIDQAQAVAEIRGLDLTEEEEAAILGGNAAGLLNLA